ncbi:hypothetical protein OG308_20340 [Nocardia salmonicida]|uniref:Uncharacterized protein n=1 Tax=Nocardia salmonicida TaxID=53431 RepID=A0ABZ1N156_9NOCA
MRAELTHRLRQWGSAVPAVVASGMLAPVGPRKAVALARGRR